MRRFSRLYILLFLLCVLPSLALAQEDGSTWSFSLDSVTVRSYRYRSPVKSDVEGVTVWDMNSMSQLPQILGNADPMHYAQMLPGIQTNSEYRSGINIEGCDNQHNAIAIEGVPIYNVNHLLGFFSTFNAAHFSSMSIAKGVVSAKSSNRLGGQLEVLQDTRIPDSVSGIVSVGLVSSQGTIRLPLNARTAVTASLRGSYINMLYDRWLDVDGYQTNYSFYDANVTLVHHINNEHKLMFDFYNGSDYARLCEGYYLAKLKARWGNTMGAVHWMYDREDFSSRTTLYTSHYRNRFGLQMQDMEFRLPSGISDWGIRNDVLWERWSAGGSVVWHHIRPQSVEHRGNFNNSSGRSASMHSLEASLYANYEYPLTEYLSLSGGVRGSLFRQSQTTFYALDPSLRLLYDDRTMQLSATYATRHQYLFQTGFSDSGLPTEFWISAGHDFKPQYVHELSAAGSRYFLDRRLRVSLDVFYRRLYHQLGYKGSVLDYVNTIYNLNQSVMHGDGENYGFSVMLNKCAGKLTGWVSYTYTHARRSFDEIGRDRTYPASHERPHEVNGVATYAVGTHWSFGVTAVCASGTPFTAAKSVYLLNNNLLITYGDYNANRLSPYIRVDLSATYKWKSRRGGEHGFNGSLYNVSGHDNELFYYLSIRDDGSFVYKPVTFLLPVLPSVSYYYKF